jgi:hypothetical protein
MPGSAGTPLFVRKTEHAIRVNEFDEIKQKRLRFSVFCSVFVGSRLTKRERQKDSKQKVL